MDFTNNSPCIVGYACRLPGATQSDTLFDLFESGDRNAASTQPPLSRGFGLFSDGAHSSRLSFGRGGWLGERGVEQFDPDFFRIPASEADTLRPNVRLALELTWEALEHAGIPPSTLQGRNVSVSFGIGTEDGWDMQRLRREGSNAFNEHWAASSDPSGVSGRVSHFFDFRGTSVAVSNACASGGFAVREGIMSLCYDDAEVAIVGSVATHFNPSPFAWAAALGVSSTSGTSSSFSPDADGYSPSEGAVVLVLKRFESARKAGDVIHARILSLATAHSGSTRTMFTPSMEMQASLLRRTLHAAKLSPGEIDICEAHGTGTPVGDSIEAEAIRSVFGSRSGDPLLLSSSKTVLGHCHSSAALVGILKILACFERRAVPPHRVEPLSEFRTGSILIPSEVVHLHRSRIRAQLNAGGFTGSIVSFILETGPPVDRSPPSPTTQCAYFLPFSHHHPAMLEERIRAITAWATCTRCPLPQLAAILGLCREHHRYRKAIIVHTLDDLARGCSGSRFSPLRSPEERLSEKIFSSVNDSSHVAGDTLLDRMQQLYEGGESLSFSTVYEKGTIDRTLLSSFPLHSFNRRQCWKRDNVLVMDANEYQTTLHAPPPLQRPDRLASSLDDDEKVFADLIAKYGALPPQYSPRPLKTALSDPTRSCVLLTGANGMLGARLLDLLIQLPNITTCCLLRGNGWERLKEAFANHGLSTESLEAAGNRRAIRIFSTADICASQFGLSQQDYSWICRNVDQIVHAAWAVNFDLPLSEFYGLLSCTRGLAELCLLATKRVRYFFIGTYASTFGYQSERVPESVLPPRRADAIEQGYAVSKQVAEHALLHLVKSTKYAFDLSVVRVGQICGDTAIGAWSANEIIPMFISSLPILRVLPSTSPSVAWIPSDICAAVLRDFLVLPRTSTRRPAILHIANPSVSPWTEVAHDIARIAGITDFKVVPMQTFIQRIKEYLVKSDTVIAVARILPFFESIVDKSTEQRFTALDVTMSRRLSHALDSCPPIGGALLRKIVSYALQSSASQPIRTSHTGHIFVFGPAVVRKDAVSPSPQTMSRITEAAGFGSRTARNELDGDPLLHHQLRTLAAQVDAVDDLYARGITPSVVAGYCFGEYAAAVTAGVFTLEIAVQTLVQRARAVRGIDGALLNVFADITVTRRVLALLSCPPAIAIIAGPTHTVLSGSDTDIRAALEAFSRAGVKSIFTPSQLPSHTPLLDSSARSLIVPQYSPPTSGKVHFVSGITGTVLPSERVTASYWKRHMCTRFDFHGAMCAAKRSAPCAQVVDVGPGELVGRIIARYGGEWRSVGTVQPVGATEVCSASPQLPLELFPGTPVNSQPDLQDDDSDPKEVALSLIAEMLGYEASEELLLRSLHALGMHSLDFIRFSERLLAKTGKQIMMSAYVSDVPLAQILDRRDLTV